MDKYEYKIRAEEIKELIAQGEYVQAAEIADTIDWRRVKSVMMLCTISDLYKINRRYEDARDMLLLAYERRPGGRTICYSLCELSIKMEEFVQAVEYYKEFVQIAPKDTGRYILQYKLYEAQDVSLEERIEVLEELKKRDYREKWAYELAYLYHRVGLATRCVEECDELILWFGEGKYVIKAMELKMLHEPLTEAQQAKYDNRFNTGSSYVQESAENTYSQADEAMQEDVTGMSDSMYSENMASDGSMGYDNGAVSETAGVEDAMSYGASQNIMNQDTKVFGEMPESAEEELDIQVKTMNVGQYDTINLQEELAAGLREVLEGESRANVIEDPITRSIVAPMMESDTESLDYPQIDEIEDEDMAEDAEEMESSEVFFGETGEIGDLEQAPKMEVLPDITGRIVMEQMREETIAPAQEPTVNAEPPKELANVLSQESDGQISLVVPESENIEKQITGQMSIEDILLEWERMKKENEEKRKEEVRKHVLEQTGTMFTDFEASVRDGLLERLESGAMSAEDAVAAAGNMQDADPTEDTEWIASEEYANVEEMAEEEVEADETEMDSDAMQAEEAVAEEEALAEAADEYGEVEEIAEIEDVAEIDETIETEDAVEIEENIETEDVDGIEEPMDEFAQDGEFEMEYETEAELEMEFEEELEADVEVELEAEVDVAPEREAETEFEPEVEAELDADGVFETEVESEAAIAADDEAEPAPATEAEAEPEPAIERDKMATRSLTPEEKELFGAFIQSKSEKEQLIQVIDNITMAAYTGNVIITGEEGVDTLSLAKNLVREVQNNDNNFSGKVAKISGSALNNKDVAATIEQLKNGALIIQKAAQMENDTVSTLYKCLQQESLGIIVILEDTKRYMNRFLSEHPVLTTCFTARMDVEALSNDTLVAFGRKYAYENEYAIDELGILALHTRIEEMQTSDHVVTIAEVKEIVDEAIYHANKKTIGHFFDVLLSRRYDDEDMIVLTEKDFA